MAQAVRFELTTPTGRDLESAIANERLALIDNSYSEMNDLDCLAKSRVCSIRNKSKLQQLFNLPETKAAQCFYEQICFFIL